MREDGMSAPLRTMVHHAWAGVAANWGRYADALDSHETAVTERMLEAVAVQPGDRVLELACGPGGVGLAAAPLAGGDGEVVLSDVAEEMGAIVVDRAHTRGLTNVRGARLDLEDIDQPDASYDVVLCRQGLMFAVDSQRAAREIHRVLRPAGEPPSRPGDRSPPIPGWGSCSTPSAASLDTRSHP
jgi:ubiquinone/menaquinone biosynthesis C-methylase UbiE